MDLRNLSTDHRFHLSSNSSDSEAFLEFLLHSSTEQHMPSGSYVSVCVHTWPEAGVKLGQVSPCKLQCGILSNGCGRMTQSR